MDRGRIENGMREILEGIGSEYLNPEVLAETPRRVAAMYEEFFAGIDRDPGDALRVIYKESYEEMIVMKGIPFFSICEHHFLPFVGTADIVYIPVTSAIRGSFYKDQASREEALALIS